MVSTRLGDRRSKQMSGAPFGADAHGRDVLQRPDVDPCVLASEERRQGLSAERNFPVPGAIAFDEAVVTG